MANITIVGAGNSGTAHAYYLSRLGHKITLLKTSRSLHDDNFEALMHNGGVWGRNLHHNDSEPSFQRLELITRDPAEAFKNAELVMVLTQSLQHETVAQLIGPYIGKVKALIVVPGNLGSIYFRKYLPANAFLSEGESTIIDARISAPGEVDILFSNVRNCLSFLPASRAESGLEYIHGLIPNYTHTRTNVIETALHNPNLIVHTIGTIMSASRIEMSHGEFWLYREGFSPSIWNLIKALDKEKNAVIEAFGGVACNYLDCCKFRNEDDLSLDSFEVFMNYAYNGSPKGPSSIHNRYITEDVPNGLCLLSTLGDIAGIPTPVADSLINIASTLLDTDFSQIGRTRERLGIPADFNEIMHLIN